MSNPKLIKAPKYTRNICIMAHVDHGKTTLADALVASNGIINQRQAGKIRYMDSRKDEIERGITMKSSCVSLTYPKDDHVYIINLIDSPGHVDFSSEVSTAVRLCDGTIIVVDVLEGVCAQTKVVLKQAWLENIRPALVLNKIDRLVLERKMTPLEAYYHISHVLEQVNAYMGELYNTDVFGRISASLDERKRLSEVRRQKRLSEGEVRVSESTSDALTDWELGNVDDTDIYFSPEKGNVVFASAADGWGFRLENFARQFSSKIGLDTAALTASLWGDYYITSKGGKRCILNGARDKGKDPLFVSLILDNVFKVYQSIIIRKDAAAAEKMAKLLNVSLPMSVVKSTDFVTKLRYILGSWLPLAVSVLDMVTGRLPSAAELSEERVTKLLCSATQRFESLPQKTQKLKQAFLDAQSGDDATLIVFVSKLFAVDVSCINDRNNVVKVAKVPMSVEEIRAKREEIKFKEAAKSSEDRNTDMLVEEAKPSDEILVAFARVFSGTLTVGQKVYILGPKHSPNSVVDLVDENDQLSADQIARLEHVNVIEVSSIYLLMGRQLERVRSAPCGSIVGIGGLESVVIKSATLSSSPLCPAFTDLTLQATPILRVAVEPQDPRELKKLREGLRILNQADPCVEICLEENGEYVLVTAGEVHLERCITDLQERYGRIALTTSDPIVPFRETIIETPKMDRLNEAIEGENIIEGKTENSSGIYEITSNIGTLRIRALPLPVSVTKLLEENSDTLKTIADLFSKSNSKNSQSTESPTVVSDEALVSITVFRDNLKDAFSKAGPEWENAVDHIWSFGPHFNGPNLLLNHIKDYKRPSIFEKNAVLSSVDSVLVNYDTNLNMGFQMATSSGPLCEEPMFGICFCIEEWSVNLDNELGMNISGQVISLAKESFRKAFESCHQRLMCAMYSCEISVDADVVGRVYNVLGKRHGRIIDGDITEGSTSWNVTAFLPVVESFSFSNDLRKATSGEAMPQLVFSHWEILDIDPSWVPQTTEELAHWGEKADSDNLAKKYINAVRRRKGLFVDDKIVEFAEKQRNLSKNK